MSASAKTLNSKLEIPPNAKTLKKALECRKSLKQKGMILTWENGKLVGFRFRYLNY